MSFKPGRAFGDQVASSFDRRRNWFARRKWERKEEIKRPPRFRSHRKAAVPWRNSFLALYFSSLHLVNVRPPWGQFHPAAFWKQVVILPVWRDAIRVSWSDVCPHPRLTTIITGSYFTAMSPVIHALTCTNPSNSHTAEAGITIIIMLTYKQKSWSPERFSCLSRVAQTEWRQWV